MKYLLGVILLLGFTMCKSYKLLDKTNNLNSNFYRGHVFFVEAFITVSQDSAIAEWYYLDGPCQAFSDTLIADKNGSKEMIGKTSQIFYNNDRFMYFKTMIPYEPPKIVQIKMKLDNNYKKIYEQNRNKYTNGNYIR